LKFSERDGTSSSRAHRLADPARVSDSVRRKLVPRCAADLCCIGRHRMRRAALNHPMEQQSTRLISHMAWAKPQPAPGLIVLVASNPGSDQAAHQMPLSDEVESRYGVQCRQQRRAFDSRETLADCVSGETRFRREASPARALIELRACRSTPRSTDRFRTYRRSVLSFPEPRWRRRVSEADLDGSGRVG
jgi:hypothetical protein